MRRRCAVRCFSIRASKSAQALARSLAPHPAMLLLDEPLNGLDPELHDRLAADLAALLRSTGTTALIVTHDRAEAATIADRTVVLGRGPLAPWP